MQQLAAFDATFADGLTRLRQRMAAAQLPLDSRSAAAQEQAYVEHATQIILAHQTKVEQTAQAQQQLHAFERQQQALDALLTTFVRESETAMAAREDRSKTLTQSGEATVEVLEALLSETLTESYPIVQGAYKLMRYLIQMQDAARAYIATEDDGKLAALEARFQQSAKAAAALLKRLLRRVTATSSQLAVDALVQGFSQLEALVVADHGLFATHRAALAANLNA
jgi:hypothetical protein